MQITFTVLKELPKYACMFIIASHLGEVCYIRTTNINESWLFLFLLPQIPFKVLSKRHHDDYNTGYFGPRFDY